MNTIIHIGMHKTGTTFLQKEVFPRSTNYSYLANRSLRGIYHPFREKNQRDLIISDEILSGNPYEKNTLEDFKFKIDCIHQLFGRSRILVAFREHSSYVTSVYNQYLQQGGNISIQEFFNLEDTGILKSEDIQYKIRLDYLKNLFEDVTVYSYEDFKNDPQQMTTLICQTLGIEVSGEIDFETQHNKSISSDIQYTMLRRLNKLNLLLGGLLSSRIFKKWNLTPRKIAQRRLANVTSKAWSPEEDYLTSIQDHFNADWEFVQNAITVRP